MSNKVELIGYYGSDEVIACSAWTSTSRNLTEAKKARVGKLIDMLWSEGHETPFEKGIVHFLVDTDIASHIHLLKHRISSLNAESARYKELKEDKYYTPEDWKDIAISDDSVDDLSYITSSRLERYGISEELDKRIMTWYDALGWYTEVGNDLYHRCLADLEPVLGRKRAKESARFFKTYNSQIQADIMFNMRSFANFIKLRNSEHAQLEIREIAQQMWNEVEKIENEPFKHTLDTIRRNM